jgi:hypothetical protein
LKLTGFAEVDKLRGEVTAARARLRLVEDRHERALDTGSRADVVTIGREYATAVQEYLHAVMAWLIWLEKRGQAGGRSA